MAQPATTLRLPTLGLSLDRHSPVPLFRQISDGIRAGILAGEWPEGMRLPPERLLARALGVNRSTILAAYRQLKDDGLVSAHVGRGTEVLPVDTHGGVASAEESLPWEGMHQPRYAAAADPIIRDLLDARRPDTISLALGVPAAEFLPMEEMRDVQSRVLAEIGAEAMLHSPTEGLPALREALCGYLAPRGIRCSPGELLVTSGSQQALDLVARVFLSPEDTVLVEEPTYLGALQVFRRAGVRLLGVPVDAEGMRVDVLESMLTRMRPRLIYTLPTFQNPSGVVMSLSRRRRLLDLAWRYHVPILEEDSYSDLRYDGEALPSLRILDTRGHVLYLSTFSKVLFPGLRVGWLAGPPQAVRQLAVARQSVDLHTATPNQWVMERFLREGHLQRHLERVRPEYRKRRDAMLAALRPLADLGLRWVEPEGGYYVWCRLPDTVSLPRLAAEAAREGVSFLPGTVFSTDGSSDRHLRLNFTSSPPERLSEGIRRLGRALEAARTRHGEGVFPAELHRPLV